MPFYKFHKSSRPGQLITELHERICEADKKSREFIAEFGADTYLRDERCLAGEIIGILFLTDLHSGRARRKHLKKVGEHYAADGTTYFHYFPADTHSGKRLLERMRSLPRVKEAELNLIFGVQSITNAVEYQLCNSGYYVVSIKREAPKVDNEITPLIEEIGEEEVEKLINK